MVETFETLPSQRNALSERKVKLDGRVIGPVYDKQVS